EAQAAASLNHANIVAVFDAGEWDGVPFIVMELVEGLPLSSAKSDNLQTILSLADQVCEALAHAHAKGIIHRDLKPENVLVTPNGRAKLMDFGLARSASASPLTVAGAIVGTVHYLAPENALGQAIDERADLYSFGVMLYQLAAGGLRFESDDLLGVITQHLHAPVTPPSTFNPAIPAALDALLLRLLSKNPQDRPGSAQEVQAELQAIRQALESAEISPSADVDLPVIRRLARGRLVGRERELVEARALWERAANSEGQAFLVSGEPGVGKTRFAEELIAYARLRGARILRGGCYEYEATTPYLPLAEALRDWVHAQADSELQALPLQTAAELARLAPEIEARLGALPPNPPLGPEQERLRLFDHLARFLGGLAARSGLLLFVDDLHWSDNGTISFLQYLLRRLRGERLLVLGAYREIELDRAHPLSAALVDWNRARLVTRQQLSRLSLEDCSQLLAAMFGQTEITQEFAEAIYRETEGNPFFVEEVVKALVEQGQIYRQDGEWERRSIDDLSIPQSIKEAIGRRLDRLSPATVETLQQAAVLGKTFAYAELAAVEAAPGNEPHLLDAIDEALTAQLLNPGPGESFVFTHDKLREVLYEELNPVRRRRYHQHAADGIERLYPGKALEAHVQDLAYHYLHSGDLQRALDYSLRAARHAQQVYASDEALLYYRSAVECASGLNLDDQLVDIYCDIGDVYASIGLFSPSVDNFQRALDLATSTQVRAVLKSRIGAAYTAVGDLRGLEFLQTAERELDPQSQKSDLASNLMMQGRFYHYQARHAASIEYLQRARALAEDLNQINTIGQVYGYLAGAYQHLAQLDESMRWARASIELGERTNNPTAIATGIEFLAEDYSILSQWSQSLEYAERDREMGEQYGFQDRIAWAFLPRSFSHHGMGQLVLARQDARQGLALAEEIGELRLAVWLRAMQGLAEADLGNSQVAVALTSQALEQARQLQQIIMAAFARHCLARSLAAQGDQEGPLRLAQEAFDSVANSENLLARLYAGLAWVTTLAEAGEPSQALSASEDYLALTRRVGARHWEGIALRCQAQACIGLERWPDATQALQAAISVFESLGSQLELGRALYQRARISAATGERREAGEYAARALPLLELCAASLDAAAVSQFIQSRTT
ncbi:MAG TPA: AAA family ATPase, partial [Anaerolineales bacterium]|nr:AAA family ATPase [Anaerolineales bacterium]